MNDSNPAKYWGENEAIWPIGLDPSDTLTFTLQSIARCAGEDMREGVESANITPGAGIRSRIILFGPF